MVRLSEASHDTLNKFLGSLNSYVATGGLDMKERFQIGPAIHLGTGGWSRERWVISF